MFATDFAHDLRLSIKVHGSDYEAPVRPDSVQQAWSWTPPPGRSSSWSAAHKASCADGGLRFLRGPALPARLSGHGHLGNWRLAMPAGLIVGRQEHGASARRGCEAAAPKQVMLRDEDGNEAPAAWSAVDDSELRGCCCNRPSPAQ
ncbi:MAG: hypothetical protein U1F35_13285 [Steroidobacteraceae bacterium]